MQTSVSEVVDDADTHVPLIPVGVASGASWLVNQVVPSAKQLGISGDKLNVGSHRRIAREKRDGPADVTFP